jgi:hypothetical protein
MHSTGSLQEVTYRGTVSSEQGAVSLSKVRLEGTNVRSLRLKE